MTSEAKYMDDWMRNAPRRLTFPVHGSSVVTCALISHGRIITASDDHEIHVYSPETGERLHTMKEHEGGVWALAVSPNYPNILVSGSTDQTIRIWDLSTGKCTHVFYGHTSTVRCVAIATPVWTEVDGRMEKWPKRSLIVSGSRDSTLRVWNLPRRGYKHNEAVEYPEVEGNPYHLRVLKGHNQAVRALAAHGSTAVSGSYDTTLKVWNLITGECKWTLTGHTQKVYSVAIDSEHKQVISGSMDGTARIWSLVSGQTLHTLTSHTSLIGLIGVSSTNIVTGAADSILCVWDPSSGALKHKLAAHTGAITCFQHDEYKMLSGSDEKLFLWDIREGKVVREMLGGITLTMWQVAFEGNLCVAASHREEQSYLDIWDFSSGKEVDDEVAETLKGSSEEEDSDEDS
ncbi:SCF ubiquitin ligase complex subunit cdc4 [Ceratobasidium sp. UAMH 11750]|nr:SCF ubiquitin ligase complex subunit cdc4 [Ceratobasidium sp. UAMH 11750]